MDMSIDPLLNLQQDVQNAITKARFKFSTASKELISRAYIETRLEYIEEQWKLFIDTHRTIITDVDKEDYYSSTYYTDDVYEVTLQIYCDFKTELKESLNSIVESKSTTGSTSSGQGTTAPATAQVKLPKIIIPSFSGKYTDWTTFKELFLCLVHNNPNLGNVQKHHYLKAHLTGEAELLLRYIPVSDATYSDAWELLNKRFGNKKYLSNILLKRMVSQPNVTSESSAAVKELLDTTCDCLNGLNNQDVNTDSWDTIVIFLISSKLDLESRKLWEAQVSTSNDHPTLQQFKEFLEHRYHSLEFMSFNLKKSNTIRINVHHASVVSCLFCSEHHRLYRCKNFTSENVKARHGFVQQNNLCYNCLLPGHSVFSCRKYTRCRVCGKKHHSLLHNDIADSNNSIVKNSPVEKPSSLISSDTEYRRSTARNHVLLPTALVKVTSQSGHQETIRSLLDQASEASFISEAAVHSLGLKQVPMRSLIAGFGNQVSNCMVSFRIKSIHDPNVSISVKAHVLKRLTGYVPSLNIRSNKYQNFNSLMLADPHFHTTDKIDIVLGADVFSNIVMEGLLKDESGLLVAQNTRFGWILSGQANSETDSQFQSK